MLDLQKYRLMFSLCQRYISPYLDYELEKGKCFSTSGSDLTSNGLIGCLVDNGNTCSNCANGFIKVERLCQKAVKYCSEYDSSNKCLRC